MKNIWDVYQYNLTRFNKEQSGRSLTPDEFNTVISVSVLEYFKLKIGIPEQYQVGLPISPQQWQVSQKITDDCRHLLVWMGSPDNPLMKLDEYGIAKVPTDYVAFSSCYYDQQVKLSCGKTIMKPRSIEFVPDGVWADRVVSPIKYPTDRFPIAKWFGDKIQFMPRELRYVNFTYLRIPKTPFLATTTDENNDFVYLPNQSTQIDFPEICLPDIANLAAGIMAGQIQSTLYLQLTESRKQRGI